jgi:Protein of unknown function (DUF3011)
MANLTLVASATLAFCLHMATQVAAQNASDASDAAGAAAQSQAPSLSCASKPGQRTQCPAVTAAGVALLKSTGSAACLLGKTWGYDDKGVWVMDGCSGEFLLGAAAQAAAQTTPPANGPTVPAIETWGEFDPGQGFLVGRSSAGELAIAGYALARYINQTPGVQDFTDHLGNTRPVDGRHDIYPHRVMIFFKGWLGNPKLFYAVTFWTVLDTSQNAIFANLGYQFSRKFSVYAGLNGNPGTRSLQGSHPFWLGHDRVMADEFFRPFFGSGVWAQGEPVPGLWYNVMLGTSNSILDVKSSQLDRTFTTGASAWWMPTTKEFGPKGAYGDWEMHEKVATRFGVSWTQSPEQPFTDANTGIPGNTTLRLADSVNVFETGALTPGVTVDRVDYQILSFDAGMKYRGIFLQTEIYNRWLDDFTANGALPVTSIHDTGFYIQAAFFPVPKQLELYTATSQILGDKGAGFDNSSEYLVGMNFYPANTRNHRLNLQLIDVNSSPVSSAFGYYVGGQTGTTFAASFSVYF